MVVFPRENGRRARKSVSNKSIHFSYILNLTTLNIFLYKPWRPKGFFQFEIIITVLVSSFRFIWIPMLWVYGHYKYFHSYSAGIDFSRQNLTSRRQILTTKVDPRTVRVKWWEIPLNPFSAGTYYELLDLTYLVFYIHLKLTAVSHCASFKWMKKTNEALKELNNIYCMGSRLSIVSNHDLMDWRPEPI